MIHTHVLARQFIFTDNKSIHIQSRGHTLSQLCIIDYDYISPKLGSLSCSCAKEKQPPLCSGLIPAVTYS